MLLCENSSDFVKILVIQICYFLLKYEDEGRYYKVERKKFALNIGVGTGDWF